MKDPQLVKFICYPVGVHFVVLTSGPILISFAQADPCGRYCLLEIRKTKLQLHRSLTDEHKTTVAILGDKAWFSLATQAQAQAQEMEKIDP